VVTLAIVADPTSGLEEGRSRAALKAMSLDVGWPSFPPACPTEALASEAALRIESIISRTAWTSPALEAITKVSSELSSPGSPTPRRVFNAVHC